MAVLVSTDDAKAFLKFRNGVDDEALFTVAYTAGTQAVIDFLEWDPNLQATTEIVDGYGAPSVALKRAPVTVVSAVKVSGAAIALTGLVTQGRMLLRRDGIFPLGKASVEVTYTAGYNPLPDPITLGTKMAIKALWTAPGFELNFASHSIAGVESASFIAGGPGSLPPGARALLQPYRRNF
jgi:hypothetical protein